MLNVKNVSKCLGGKKILKHIDLELKKEIYLDF